jgi:glycine oxidase
VRCIVIGAGAVGCAVAWRLRQRGYSVTLVDRGPPAGEASQAAAGILSPQAEAHGPGPLFELSLKSREKWPAFAAELEQSSGMSVGYRRTGTRMLALDETEAAALAARADWQRAAGLRADWQAPALHLPDDHQVEPPLLGAALWAAAERSGARLVTGWARRILGDGARVTGVLVDDQPLDAERVVLAAGAWSSLVDGLPPLPRVRPLRGQLLELTGSPGLVESVVFGDGGYLVPRADGRVLVGSSEEEAGFVKQVTPEVLARLCRRALRLAPELASAAVTRFWSGLRPTTDDRLPVLGATALAGLIAATGHHRNGILLAPITAEIVAALVAGEPPAVELQPFSPAR